MKKYRIDVHYNMVIRDIEVIADSIGEACRLARQKADAMPLEAMECEDTDCDLSGDFGVGINPAELTAEELRSKEREAVTEFVTKYIGWCESDIDTAEDKDIRRAFRRKLARYAYEGRPIAWTYAVGNVPQDHPCREWLTDFYKSLDNGTHPRTELYNRYARMYARSRFERRYKSTAKSLFEANGLQDCDKLQKKQAVTAGVAALCTKMEEYVMNEGDTAYKSWEPQMTIRYDYGTDENGNEDYWNLFVYCHGPNDGDDASDLYELATAWQHQHYAADGRDLCDDYGTEFHDTRAALIRYLFYAAPPAFEETDEQPSQAELTDVWVD